MDAQLQLERGGRNKRTYRADSREIPDGVFIALDGNAWLVYKDALLAWSDSGYTQRRARPAHEVDVLTPPSIVAIIAAGYRPGMHPSAELLL